MAERLFKDHLYGDLLSPSPGYSTDFALGMTYSLSFEALLSAHLSFGMLGEMDDNTIQTPHILLDAITKNSDKVVVFCNKGCISVPTTANKVYSLMEHNIFEVFDKKDIKANFHPKLWLIREVNTNNKKEEQLKLIVTSRNLSYTDTIDCIACLTGKIEQKSYNNEKHNSLVAFIQEVAKTSNIEEEPKKKVLKLAKDLERVKQFDIDSPFDDYDFYPYLFKKDFGLPNITDYLVGTESIIVSPFIDKSIINILNPKNKCRRTLITRKEYVDRELYDDFNSKGGIYVTLDDLASRGMDLHAKMYHVWYSRDEQYLYLGSANATRSAFNRNGEFLLGLKYKYGNTRSSQFLKEFYEEGNSDSKFMPMKEPQEKTISATEWDDAETAMKQLMCADDLVAHITHHRDGNYSIEIKSKIKKLINDVYIAPIQKKELKQLWTGRVEFKDLNIDELSVFFILYAKNPDGKQHQTVIKIETIGMPSKRDQEIYKGIIKTKKDFYRFLELLFTDSPLQYISNELIVKEAGNTNDNKDESIQFSSLYEKMLKIAAHNPYQILEIGKLINKLGDEVVPESFIKVYKQFVAAVS